MSIYWVKFILTIGRGPLCLRQTIKRNSLWAEAYLRGAIGPWPPFRSPRLQNCIEKWAKSRHGPPFARLATGFELEITWFWIWVKTFFFALHLIFGEKSDEIWVKTFFFCSSPDFRRKSRTNFECGNFNFRTMLLSNFLKFLARPFSKSCVRYCLWALGYIFASKSRTTYGKLIKN